MEQVTLCQILENFIPNDGSKCFNENGKAIEKNTTLTRPEIR